MFTDISADVVEQLFDSVWEGKLSQVKNLLQQGVPVDSFNQESNSCLLQEAIYQSLGAVGWDSQSNHATYLKIMDCLLENGADPNRRVKARMNTAKYTTYINELISNDDCYFPEKELDILVTHGASVNMQDSNGHTPLHKALSRLSSNRLIPVERCVLLNVVEWLLDTTADPYVTDYNGISSVEYANRLLKKKVLSDREKIQLSNLFDREGYFGFDKLVLKVA